jgi:DNA-binding winged helix-turn-helix (wHTH) protein
VRLQRIPLELLFLLIERRGEVVTREEILERVGGKGVHLCTENSINIAVRKLRQALQDAVDAPRFAVTVPARGYRFVARIGTSKSVAVYPSLVRTAQSRCLVGGEREVAELQSGLEESAAER